jgi:hypothetical protein
MKRTLHAWRSVVATVSISAGTIAPAQTDAPAAGGSGARFAGGQQAARSRGGARGGSPNLDVESGELVGATITHPGSILAVKIAPGNEYGFSITYPAVHSLITPLRPLSAQIPAIVLFR